MIKRKSRYCTIINANALSNDLCIINALKNTYFDIFCRILSSSK